MNVFATRFSWRRRVATGQEHRTVPSGERLRDLVLVPAERSCRAGIVDRARLWTGRAGLFSVQAPLWPAPQALDNLCVRSSLVRAFLPGTGCPHGPQRVVLPHPPTSRSKPGDGDLDDALWAVWTTARRRARCLLVSRGCPTVWGRAVPAMSRRDGRTRGRPQPGTVHSAAQARCSRHGSAHRRRVGVYRQKGDPGSRGGDRPDRPRSEEHTSELQSQR